MFPVNIGLIHSHSTSEALASSQATLRSIPFDFGYCLFAPSLKQVWVARLLAALLDCTNLLRTETLCETRLLNVLSKSRRITFFAVPYF